MAPNAEDQVAADRSLSFSKRYFTSENVQDGAGQETKVDDRRQEQEEQTELTTGKRPGQVESRT